MAKENPAKRAKRAVPKTIRLRCIVANGPWTHERPLEQGEEADVPEPVAVPLLARNVVLRG